MATGGYKLVSFSWEGKRSGSALDVCKYILFNFCKAIVDSNTGWDWDESLLGAEGSIDNYKQMGGYSDNSPNIAYPLVTTVDGTTYSLVVGLNYRNFTAFRQQDCVLFPDSTTYNFYGSLYVGMMKGGNFVADDTYGLIPGSTGQFLRWMHFNSSTHSSYTHSFAYMNQSGHLYTYYALIKGAQLGIFCRDNQWDIGSSNGIKGFICGEIFKETAHTSDTNTFGSIYLNGCDHTSEAAWNSSYQILANSLKSSGQGILWFNDTYPVYCCTFSQIFKANGNLLSGVTSSTSDRVQLKYDLNKVYNWTCNTVLSPGGRWTPCYVYYHCQDQITNGVVSGDSFKGFIDTDLLRGVNPKIQNGQLLGVNGDFLHIGGGFAIGWDSTNTDSMF